MSFYVVNPVSNKSNQQNIKGLVNTTLTEMDKHIDYADWQVTNSQYFTELNHATRAIDQKLQEYKSKFKGATIVVIQSDITPDKPQFMGMPTLINDFPYVKC